MEANMIIEHQITQFKGAEIIRQLNLIPWLRQSLYLEQKSLLFSNLFPNNSSVAIYLKNSVLMVLLEEFKVFLMSFQEIIGEKAIQSPKLLIDFHQFTQSQKNMIQSIEKSKQILIQSHTTNPLLQIFRDYDKLYIDQNNSANTLIISAKNIELFIDQYKDAWQFFLNGYQQIKSIRSPLFSDYFLEREYRTILQTMQQVGEIL